MNGGRPTAVGSRRTRLRSSQRREASSQIEFTTTELAEPLCFFTCRRTIFTFEVLTMIFSRQYLSILVASSAAAALVACGGGGSGSPLTLDPPSGGPATGSITGAIASIVGDYTVAVTKFDCSAANQNPATKLELQANGSCKVTSTQPGQPPLVTLQRDILPEGRYILRIASDGSMEMLQGTASKAKVSCPAGGVCAVTGAGTLTTYTLAGGSAAGVGVTQVILTSTGSAKSVLSGAVYAIGNVTFTGTNPIATGESGILIFASP